MLSKKHTMSIFTTKKMTSKFNVLFWSFNKDTLEPYDVLPYFRRRYKERKGKKNEYLPVPKTFDEFKEFVKQESQYNFWGRCEYEMICHGWPAQKNEHKLDIHEQIMMNLDIVADLLYNELKDK